MQWHHWWWLKGMPMACMPINTTVVSFKLLVDRRQTASGMWVYSYSKKGCRREWRTANVERRLHDRKKLWLRYLICKISEVAFTLGENEYTNYEPLSEGSWLQGQKKLTLFSIERPPCFLAWTVYCIRFYLASHKKFRNIALNCCFRMKPLQLNAEEHGQTI